MPKRLNIRIDERELAEIRAAARRENTSVSEWVRQALRAAHRRESNAAVDPTTQRKLDAVRVATEYSFPTANIDQMLAEIERGYDP